MFQPLYVAATGLSSIQDEMVNITNNLANAKTIAFKKGRTDMESLFYVEKSFKDILDSKISELDPPPLDVEYGTGVRVVSTSNDFTQGANEITNNPLDFAIQGEGFFKVKMADGTVAYTRAGNFHIDNDGNLADPNGRLLDPGINFPSGTTNVAVRQDGTVYCSVNNETSLSEIGQIGLVRFTNPAGLKAIGQNLYQPSESSGPEMVGIANQDGYGSINQFSLEQSNVDVISEMMRMVIAQRVFDTVTKAVQSYDGVLTALERMKQ